MRRIRQGAGPFSKWDYRALSHHARGHFRGPDLRTRRRVAAAGLILGCTVITVAGVRMANAFTQGDEAAAADLPPAPSVTSPPPRSSPKAPPLTKRSTPPGSSSQGSSAGASSERASSDRAPQGSSEGRSVHSTGSYSRAPGASARHGTGPLKTYRVEVETGAGQSASAFAAAVDATLADRASWTGQGLWSLQRVADSADFVVRLATPDTVDTVCATAGLNTRGYVSCRAGRFVMLNLDRWLGAVPDYQGDIALYRHYLVNHEVGHQLGYGHEACPGPGRLAPVMQQQTYGLRGCRANGWPYLDGELVSGPAAR